MEKGKKEIIHSNKNAAWARVLLSHLPTLSGPPNVSRELLPGLQVSALKPAPPHCRAARQEGKSRPSYFPAFIKNEIISNIFCFGEVKKALLKFSRIYNHTDP